MKTYFIIVLICIIVAIILLLIYRIKRHRLIENTILEICKDNNYSLSKKEKDCDYLISTNEKKVKLLIVSIPKNSSVTVNSKATWCLRWGGKRNGRSYPNQRYMNEIIPFLKMKKGDDDIKLIVLYKTTEKIQKYLNESEIALVSFNEVVYDYKIIRFVDLKEKFNDLL